MEKNFQQTPIAILLICLMILSISCKKQTYKKQEDVNNLGRLYSFVSNSEVINDSLEKLKMYNVKLVICSYKELNKHCIITLIAPTSTYRIRNEYFFKPINGLNILFIDNKKLLIKKPSNNNLNQLLRNNLVTFKVDNWGEESGYYKFVYCKKDSTRILCFDNVMVAIKSNECFRRNLIYNEDDFYPKCD